MPAFRWPLSCGAEPSLSEKAWLILSGPPVSVKSKIWGEPVSDVTLRTSIRPDGAGDPDALNEKLLETVNATGKLYLTHTKLNGVYTIRLVIAQTHVQQRHADEAWDLIVKTAREELKA